MAIRTALPHRLLTRKRPEVQLLPRPLSSVLPAKRLPFEAGGEPEAEGEIEIRQLFELEEFGDSPAVERGR
jgi:hypothetical protein